MQGAVRITKQAVRENKCVVIGLQSTGESRLMDVLEEKGGELSEFVSSAKGVLVNLIQKHFPAPYVKSKVISEVHGLFVVCLFVCLIVGTGGRDTIQ